MKFWQYFNVCNGHFIPYSELTFHSGLEVISAFSTTESVIEKPKQMSKKRKDREICNIQFGLISGYIFTFKSEMVLLQQLADEEHKFNESTSGMDRVRQAYSELILASSNLHQSVSTSDIETLSAEYVLSRCKSLFFQKWVGHCQSGRSPSLHTSKKSLFMMNSDFLIYFFS